MRVVHSHFHHRCGHQHLGSAILEVLQGPVFFIDFLRAPGQTHVGISKGAFFQFSIHTLGCPELRGFIFRGGVLPLLQIPVAVHLRAYDVGLLSLPDLLSQVSVKIFSSVFRNDARLNRNPALRHLIHHGQIQIAIENQGQGPGNRRGGHHQHMGPPHCAVGAFPFKGGALIDPEAVLLIRNDQSQLPVRHPRTDQRLGPEDGVACALRQLPEDFLPFAGFRGARQQTAPNPQALQAQAGLLEVLLGQDLRRRHHGALKTGAAGQGNRPEGDGCLAASHVPLNQPFHGPVLRQVRRNFPQHPALGPCGRKGKGAPVLIRIILRKDHGRGRPLAVRRACDIDQIQEHLLKIDPSFRFPEAFRTRREMDFPESGFSGAQMMLLSEFFRQDFRVNGLRLPDRLLHQGAKAFLGNARHLPIDGDQAGIRHNAGILKASAPVL